MKKIITILITMIFVCMLTACGRQETETGQLSTDIIPGKAEVVQKYTIDDPDAADLVAYFGERPLGELEEIPTYNEYLMSQARAHISDFSGDNDSRRLFFKTEIEEIVLEYEDEGYIWERTLHVKEVDSGLYRVDPQLRIFYCDEEREYIDTPHNYFTFRIKTVDGGIYYMTWVPPVAE